MFDRDARSLDRAPARLDALDVGGAVIDQAGTVDTANAASGDPLLVLQKMEKRLVRHHLEFPEVLNSEELRRLRYILNFARLTEFEPGAAGPAATRGRGDVCIGPEITSWRAKVADVFSGPLREERDAETALRAARHLLIDLVAEQSEQRRLVAEHHTSDFSLAELDAEVGYKKLVLALGGGGGAGFVYIGAMQRLLESGQVPDYMIGSSFGSIIGAAVARSLPVPIEEYIAWAKTVSYAAILGSERLRRRHGLTGMFSLRYDQFAHDLLSRDDGGPMSMSDLAIPFEAVLAGVRRQSFAALPSRFRRPALAALQLRALPLHPIGIGPQVAARMWQVAAFIDPRVVKPIVVGGDEMTGAFNVVDAVSFSSAIPGVLHHETSDQRMYPILDALLDDHNVAALVDGGVASNVPVELAWKRVRAGKLGSRNACYLAFECFHPQWDPRHLWLVPITQALQLQMVRNAPYTDHLVRFSPTLSPVNLAPSGAAIDRACRWGRQSLGEAIPVMSALLQPVWWDGDRPAVPRPGPAAPARSVASPMGAVMAAAQLPKGRFARWRNRRLT